MTNFMQTLKSFFTEATLNVALKALGAVMLVIVGFWLINKLLKFIERAPFAQKLDKGLVGFLKSFSSIALKTVLVLTAAGYLGIPTTSFLAVLGSAGLAIGLSLQGSLSNLAGGLVLLLFKPFKVGDYIKSVSEEGTVSDISIFYTTLVTIDNRTVVVPNSIISNAAVENYSTQDKRRVDMKFGAGYESDIEEVKSVILETAAAHPLILDEPAPPLARLLEQGDSALVFTARVWCARGDYWQVYFDLNEQVKKEFDKRGIAIPYPQLDIHTGP